MVHSLENQVTYIKNLDQATRVNTQVLFNLSTTVKDFMIKSHDRFYNLTRDIMWLNVTVHSQSEVYMAVRQLEFTLLQIVGGSHNMKLVMSVPLKTPEQRFSVYKVIVWPTRISINKFIRYKLNFAYFGLSFSQRDYILLKVEGMRKYTTGSKTICPADMALFDSQVLTCMASFFFQSSGDSNLCRRDVLLSCNTPTLQRHGSTWFFHFPNEQQVAIRCPNGTDWTTYHEILHDGGLIRDAETCSIASREVRTLPELSRTDFTRLDTPMIHIPDISAMLAIQEAPRIEEALPAATKELDDIKTRLSSSRQEFDVDTLMHIRRTSLRRDKQQHWYQIVTLSFCAITILLITSYFLCFSFRYILLCNSANNTPKSNPVPQVPDQESTTTDVERGQQCENISFTTYTRQQSN